MADNKAEQALKDAESKSNIKLKMYLSGDTPEHHGLVELDHGIEPLKEGLLPWLFKVQSPNGICYQYMNTTTIYKDISDRLKLVLDTAIVNAKQRESMGLLVDKLLYDLLCHDNSQEGDIVL